MAMIDDNAPKPSGGSERRYDGKRRKPSSFPPIQPTRSNDNNKIGELEILYRLQEAVPAGATLGEVVKAASSFLADVIDQMGGNEKPSLVDTILRRVQCVLKLLNSNNSWDFIK